MGLLGRLRENYRNGEQARFLWTKGNSYRETYTRMRASTSTRDRTRLSLDFLDETWGIHLELLRMHNPQGFLERWAYYCGWLSVDGENPWLNLWALRKVPSNKKKVLSPA